MILNSAFIENRKFDGVTINDTKEFIDKLLAAKDLVADVYINRKLVCSGMLKLMLNNNWVIGCVDERLSITNMADPATNLHILVHQLGYDTTDDIILSVESPLSTFIEPGDLDSDLYFSVISTVPNCTQRCFVPESMFRNLRTDNIPPKDFEECADDPTVVPTEYVIEEPYHTNPFYILRNGGDPEEPEDNYLVTYGITFDVTSEIEKVLPIALEDATFQILEDDPYNFMIDGEGLGQQQLQIQGDGTVLIKSGVVLPVIKQGEINVGTATLTLRACVEHGKYAAFEPMDRDDWQMSGKSMDPQPIMVTEES